jgi:two-component system, chemotaxis family, chemotaxis protein CheY
MLETSPLAASRSLERGTTMVGAHILVVDDDPDVRTFVSMALEMTGYSVRAVVDGREALDALASQAADLVVLDLNMPAMDGWTFCAERARRPELAGVPVVIMSARHNLTDRTLPCDPIAVLEKPFPLDTLLHIVADAVS